MIRTINFTVPGKPHGKDRPRFTKHGGAYSTDTTVKYELLVGTMYRSAGGREIEKGIPIQVHISAVYPIPKKSKLQMQMMRDNQIRPTGKPDIDNVVKIILDGLNRCAWHDDSQVVDVSAEKLYGDTPCVNVTVEMLPTGIEMYRGGARG